MALQHVEPSEVVNLVEFSKQGKKGAAAALVKSGAFEAIVMHLAAGASVPSHSVRGPITVQCLEGMVDFPVEGASRILHAGDWMYLSGGTPHAVNAQVESRLLVTILFGGSD